MFDWVNGKLGENVIKEIKGICENKSKVKLMRKMRQREDSQKHVREKKKPTVQLETAL